jgi:hypothetical protein
MPAYAIDELHNLLPKVKAPYQSSDPVIRYICALLQSFHIIIYPNKR